MGQRYLVSSRDPCFAYWLLTERDVLLAGKTNEFQSLPPPSPTGSPRPSAQFAGSPLALPPDTVTTSGFTFVPKDRAPSGSTLKASRGSSSAAPIQKVGDRWVASSIIAPSSGMPSPKLLAQNPDALRDSVQRMFDTGPDTPPPAVESLALRRDSAVTERIMAWQPVTERELSIFSRTGSKRSQATSPSFPRPDMVRMDSYTKAETALSFDPNDLNPSRSASQVRRNLSPKRQVYDLPNPLNAVEEASNYEAATTYPDPTHVSHITFPKPSVRGLPVVPRGSTKVGSLEMIPSATNSSCETGGTESIRTPASGQSGSTSPSSFDHTLLAMLDDQKTEHLTISKQIDGVHVDLRQVILSLSALVSDSRTDTEAPRGLDDKLNTISMDVKAIENALNLSNLSTSRFTTAESPAENGFAEVHQKLDAIAKLCEDVLARGNGQGGDLIKGEKPQKFETAPAGRRLGVVVDKEEAKSAGDEVAQIMAELVSQDRRVSAPTLMTDRHFKQELATARRAASAAQHLDAFQSSE